ncbi:alpha/beta hydrolase family protein [Corynebacterium sp.]|uniref:alpha/beta hydrolase n=1 Tax=Corynebacterium sp. TaxID=1720 RepID=UPI0026DCC22A|nr:alpha/beta hydrolase-fold protein [Corynebacterium sp.]MDO5032869.1 alpha/beta fold hydrolase [Corynebacterium sp.]
MNSFVGVPVLRDILRLPLTGPVNGALYTAVLVLGALLIAWRLKRRDGLSLLLALPLVVAAYAALRRWDVPVHLFVAGLVPVVAVISLIHHSGRRALMAAVAVVSAVATAGLVNVEYQSYPDVGSLDPQPVAPEMSYAESSSRGLESPGADHSAAGSGAAIVHVDLPGRSSGFHARQAIAYLPPAYWTQRLPVLVLLHGNPGGPEQWFGAGEAAETADAFQRANGGLSPIVVAVDATGSESANPICVDSPMANVMTYLSRDVPQDLKQLFRVDEDQEHWTLAGLSYGGTCSLQVLTTHPEAFGSIVDISGEPEPTIGSHRATVEKFFGGSERAFAANNPADLLSTQRYPGKKAVFITGNRDEVSLDALRELSEKARRAGIATFYGIRPGGHSFDVWRPALRDTFAWAAYRGGLSTTTDPFDGVHDDDVHL